MNQNERKRVVRDHVYRENRDWFREGPFARHPSVVLLLTTEHRLFFVLVITIGVSLANTPEASPREQVSNSKPRRITHTNGGVAVSQLGRDGDTACRREGGALA
jgi:hypothetical protein